MNGSPGPIARLPLTRSKGTDRCLRHCGHAWSRRTGSGERMASPAAGMAAAARISAHRGPEVVVHAGSVPVTRLGRRWFALVRTVHTEPRPMETVGYVTAAGADKRYRPAADVMSVCMLSFAILRPGFGRGFFLLQPCSPGRRGAKRERAANFLWRFREPSHPIDGGDVSRLFCLPTLSGLHDLRPVGGPERL